MVVFARISASVEDVIIREGEAWASDDPFVELHPELFTAAPARLRRTVAPVEQATAAPGERRRRG
jgi:hypothetical protein